MFLQEPFLDQLLQVVGGGLPGHAQVIPDELNPGVGVAEEVVQQILGVELRELGAHALLHICHLLPDSLHQRKGRSGGLLDSLKHIEHPGLPVVLFSHRLKQPVVLGFVLVDMATEVEDWDVQ